MAMLVVPRALEWHMIARGLGPCDLARESGVGYTTIRRLLNARQPVHVQLGTGERLLEALDRQPIRIHERALIGEAPGPALINEISRPARRQGDYEPIIDGQTELFTDVLRMRDELVEWRGELAERAQPQAALPVASQALDVLNRVLRGAKVTRQEIFNLKVSSEAAHLPTRQLEDSRYRNSRRRWSEVLSRLADAAPDESPTLTA